jgi:tetratricopeptide (TPR) repeat protein
MKRVRRVVIIWVLVALFLPGELEAENVQWAEERFFEANRAYKNDQFRDAADGYLELIENGFENGHIYYNLGNAYFRLGDLGKAILFYERARLLIPRDDDLIFNLAHARHQAVDDIGDVHAFWQNGFLGLDGLNLYETFFAFSVLNFFFFFILGLRLIKKAEWSYYLSIFLAIVISIGACALTLKWYAWAMDDRAVVLADEAEVRAGPDAGDTTLYKIHAGAVVSFERAEGDWTLLHLSKDKRGWTQSRQLERIKKW